MNSATLRNKGERLASPGKRPRGRPRTKSLAEPRVTAAVRLGACKWSRLAAEAKRLTKRFGRQISRNDVVERSVDLYLKIGERAFAPPSSGAGRVGVAQRMCKPAR